MPLDLHAPAFLLAQRRMRRRVAAFAAAATAAFLLLAWSTAGMAQARGARAAPGALPWSQVRIEAGPESVVVPRSQAGELPALVTSMLASPSDEDTSGGAASLRLELAQGDQAAGLLELVGERWRWTSLRSGGQSRLLRGDPRVGEALREEARRLLPR